MFYCNQFGFMLIFFGRIVLDIFKVYFVWKILLVGVCMFYNKQIVGVEILINILKFKK